MRKPRFAAFVTKHMKTQDSSTEIPSSASESNQFSSPLWSLLALWSFSIARSKHVRSNAMWLLTLQTFGLLLAAPSWNRIVSLHHHLPGPSHLTSLIQRSPRVWNDPFSQPLDTIQSLLTFLMEEGGKENKESQIGCHLISYLYGSSTELHEKLPACCWCRIQLLISKEPLFWHPGWCQCPVCNAGIETGSQPNNRLLGLCSHLCEDDLPPLHVKHAALGACEALALGHFTPMEQHWGFSC